MKDRIIKFMKSENLSASQLADDIGVQRSGISHILSGRNNPSLEFIQRILHRYPNLNPDWMLMNKGSMYRSSPQPGLFDSLEAPVIEDITDNSSLFSDRIDDEPQMPATFVATHEEPVLPKEKPVVKSTKAGKDVIKIVILYQDGTFETYLPNS